jgi:hypothetical protein
MSGIIGPSFRFALDLNQYIDGDVQIPVQLVQDPGERIGLCRSNELVQMDLRC